MRFSATSNFSRAGLAFALSGFAFAVTPVVTYAQADTAQARQLFAEVNKQLSQLERVNFVSKRPGADYKAEGKAWLDSGAIKKIEITERDDSGDVVSEFYYSGPTLVFVYEAVKGFADSGRSKKQVTTSEERYYFRDGKLFKWVSGMGNDKGGNSPGSPEFTDAAKSRLAASAAFHAAAQKASTLKAPSK